MLLSVLFVGFVTASVSSLNDDKLYSFTAFVASSHGSYDPHVQTRVPTTIQGLQAEIETLEKHIGIDKTLDPQAYLEAYLWISPRQQRAVKESAYQYRERIETLKFRLRYLQSQASSKSAHLSQTKALSYGQLTLEEKKEMRLALTKAESDKKAQSAQRNAQLASLSGQAKEDSINQIRTADTLAAAAIELVTSKYNTRATPENTAQWNKLTSQERVNISTLMSLHKDMKRKQPIRLIKGALAWQLLDESRRTKLRAKYTLKA